MPGALERLDEGPPTPISRASYVLVRPLVSSSRTDRDHHPAGEPGGREVRRIAQVFHFFRRELSLRIHRVEDPIEPRWAIDWALIAMTADLRRDDRT